MYKNKILCAQEGSVCLFLWPWYVYWYIEYSVALSICLHHDSFLLRLISQPDLLLLKY